jgi:hypothetical protein
MLALTLKRREVIALVGIAAELSWLPCGVATGEGLPQTEPAKLCDVDCEKELENVSPAYRSSTSFLLFLLVLLSSTNPSEDFWSLHLIAEMRKNVLMRTHSFES